MKISDLKNKIMPSYSNELKKIAKEYNRLMNKGSIQNINEVDIPDLTHLHDFIDEWIKDDPSCVEKLLSNQSGSYYAFFGNIAKVLDPTNQEDARKTIRDKLKEFHNGRERRTPTQTGNSSSRQSVVGNSNSDKSPVKLAELLKNAYNIILHGAPGTGKTFLAKQISKVIGATGDRMKMVQFHPSYDYTDFMEGLRPKNENGNIGFERKDGSFKEFCKKAIGGSKSDHYVEEEDCNPNIKNTNECKPNYVFIIDEINRGEIAKILGECMFSIDPGYAGEEGRIDTQYQKLIEDPEDPFKDGFYRPENVYIIGTMNDIDRGVESMDLAMRRRFVFVEIKAENTQEEILAELSHEDKVTAKKAMDNLNEIIRSKDGLGEDFFIGASYFLKIKDYVDYDDKWKLLWNYHLNGLLKEYLRGREDAESSLEEFKKTYENAVMGNGVATKDDDTVDEEERPTEVDDATAMDEIEEV